jgi:hypothetical protein
MFIIIMAAGACVLPAAQRGDEHRRRTFRVSLLPSPLLLFSLLPSLFIIIIIITTYHYYYSLF